jgi:hypothetical protein
MKKNIGCRTYLRHLRMLLHDVVGHVVVICDIVRVIQLSLPSTLTTTHR